MCLPSQHRWSATQSSLHLIRSFFSMYVPLNHTILSHGLETICSFTCPQVISQLNFLLRKPKHPGIVIPYSGSSHSTNTMPLLTTYTALYIGDATFNSCSVNTCRMKASIRTIEIKKKLHLLTMKTVKCLQLENKLHFSDLLGRGSKMLPNS